MSCAVVDALIGNYRSKKRKLILHFDQHNTIQLACQYPKRNIKEGLNKFLTSLLWGEEIDGKWVWRCDAPQLEKPNAYRNASTYYKHLERQYVVNTTDRRKLFEKTNKFTDKGHDGEQFRPYFERYLASIRCTNDNYRDDNTINDEDNPQELYYLVLPVFFDLIKKLRETNYEFTIILRSYGRDSDSFLKAVQRHVQRENFNDLNVNMVIGSFERDEKDVNKILLRLNENEIYEGDISIYNKLNSLTGICAIKDDFTPWQRNNYSCYFAKPVWINLNDENHQHLFFDDNIRFESEDDCIVNVKLCHKTNKNSNLFENVLFKSYEIFEKFTLIQPNLLELLDKDLSNNNNEYSEFFFKKIDNAYKAYDRFIEEINCASYIKSDFIYLVKNT